MIRDWRAMQRAMPHYRDSDYFADMLSRALDGRRRPNDLEGNLTQQEHVETLLELAKDNNESLFVELAGCFGVPREKLRELWTGTRRRLGFKDPVDPLAVPQMTFSPSLNPEWGP